MAKAWNGTPEYDALLKEIARKPAGTSPMEIFTGLLPETRSLLEEAGRTSGKTKEWAVYRQLCKMMDVVTTPAPNIEAIKKVIDDISALEGQLRQLKMNLNNLLGKAES